MTEKFLIGSSNHKIYDSVNEIGYYKGAENKFEDVCKSILPETLFEKKAQVFKFKSLLKSNFDDARADLMVVANDYSYFGIIEVEVSNHRLNDHILPQMKSIMSCDLTKIPYQIFNDLKTHNKEFELEKEKFIDMILNIEPKFYVVNEEYIPSWEFELAKVGIEYASISVFRDKESEPSFYFKSGRKLRSSKTDVIMIWQKYCFECKTKDYKIFENDSTIKVKYNDEIKELEVYRKNKQISLFPKGVWQYDRMKINKKYIMHFENGFFKIEEMTVE